MITKQQLGNTLWGMAEILYDKVEDYKTYILSLLFFKRLSDNWTWEIDNKVREHIATYGKAQCKTARSYCRRGTRFCNS